MDYTCFNSFIVTLFMIIHHLGWSHTSGNASPAVEYCARQIFQPECGIDEVVVLTYARYGRMRLGRCIDDDLGRPEFIGCQNDVLHLAHGKCSGRRTCSLRIPDFDFDETNPCNNAGLANYLEVSYECLQVIRVGREKCNDDGGIPISAPPSGYLSSRITEESTCGDAEHPWMLNAASGQTVILTLTDFSHDDGNLAISGTCTVYAIIKEPSVQTTKTVCGGQEYERVVYQSLGSTVEVQLRASQHKYFLLQYEFVGCLDPMPVPGATFTRQRNSGTWTCDVSRVEWAVSCEGSTWLGEAADCTLHAVVPSTTEQNKVVTNEGFTAPIASFSWTMVLILVAIITVGMVACVLIIAIVCLKRSQASRGIPVTQHPLQPMYEVYDLPAPRRVSERDVPQAYYQSLPKDYHSKKTYTDNTLAPDGRYDKPVWERPLPRPPGKGDFDA